MNTETFWWKPSPPAAVRNVPWLHPEATHYLETILRPDFDVIEHGSGGSTLWFSMRAKSVTSYERKPEWFQEMCRLVPGNVHMVPRGTYRKTAERKLYDLLLIDGDPLSDRAAWLRIARDIVRPDYWIVLDNANRPEYYTAREEMMSFARLVYRVDGNEEGRTRYLVTEFWRVR